MSIGAPDYGILSTKSINQTLIDNITFNNITTTKTSNSITVQEFTRMCLYLNVDVVSSPTYLDITIEFSNNGTDWFQLVTGPFANIRYVELTGDRTDAIDGPLRAQFIRMKAVASGTDATNKFILTGKVYLS